MLHYLVYYYAYESRKTFGDPEFLMSFKEDDLPSDSAERFDEIVRHAQAKMGPVDLAVIPVSLDRLDDMIREAEKSVDTIRNFYNDAILTEIYTD